MAGAVPAWDNEGSRAQAAAVADWVTTFAAGCYGPGGGHKVVVGGGAEARLVPSAASALREAGVARPDAAPYQALAADVQATAGDQGTAAVLLAARLVTAALDGPAPLQAYLEGYRLARRQALALLAAAAAPARADRALDRVAPTIPGAAEVVMAGLDALARAHGGVLDLDRIDVRSEPVAVPEWCVGVVATPQAGPAPRTLRGARILLLQDGWAPKPRRPGVTRRIRDAAGAVLARDEEEALRRAWIGRVEDLGVGMVVCAKALDADVVARAAARGVHVWTDAPQSALLRLADATGARPVPRASDATRADVGRADIAPRPARRGGVLVQGNGPTATLVLPACTASWAAAATDDGERLLRAAGAFLADPRAVPGGGRWQRDVAATLRRAADAAPGKSPIGVHAAAHAFDALADDIVRGLGLDPLDVRLPPDAADVLDPYPSVRTAVEAGFATAIQVLRIDARHDKAPSTSESLRGGPGRPGSPKGMPGDVPPLM